MREREIVPKNIKNPVKRWNKKRKQKKIEQQRKDYGIDTSS